MDRRLTLISDGRSMDNSFSDISSLASDIDDLDLTPADSMSANKENEKSPVKEQTIPQTVKKSPKHVRVQDSLDLENKIDPPKTPFRRSRKVIDTPIRRSARLAAKKNQPLFPESLENRDNDDDEFLRLSNISL